MAAVVAAYFAVLFTLLLVPLPPLDRRAKSLLDLLHAPTFAVAAMLSWWALRSRWTKSPATSGRLASQRCEVPGHVSDGGLFRSSPVTRTAGRAAAAISIWCVLVMAGVVTELVQWTVGREPSLSDALANASGATAGLIAVTVGSYSSRRRLAAYAIAGSLLLAASIRPALNIVDSVLQQRDVPRLASFEQPLERLRWTSDRGELCRVRQHATDGAWTLKVALERGAYPGAALRWPPADWSAYRRLVADVYLDPGPELKLIVKVQDIEHNGRVEDRFHHEARLKPGPNEIRISLADVAAAPRGRRLDLSRIAMLQFFTIRPDRPRTLYLDNIRLE